MNDTHRVTLVASPKRVRVMVAGETMADSVSPLLLLETGYRPVYYFPRRDVRTDLLEPTARRSHCPYKGDASYWTLTAGKRRVDNAVWSYQRPLPAMTAIRGHFAFYWDKADRWFEEDEEIFGHPRDPFHRIDVRASSREVAVHFEGAVVARTRRALFLFETGLPTRYYIPAGDVRAEFLVVSDKMSVCPYKGRASYWSVRKDGRSAEDAVWSYRQPLPECPRIKDHLCFDPEKVDSVAVEGRG